MMALVFAGLIGFVVAIADAALLPPPKPRPHGHHWIGHDRW